MNRQLGLVLLFLSLVFAFIAGCAFGGGVVENIWKQKAIEHGYGEYHPKTGAWQWKEAGK